jgi:hypothetical protein
MNKEKNMLSSFKLAEKLGYKLNTKQEEILDLATKKKGLVVRGTRRGGKSLLTSILNATDLLLPETDCALLAPTLSLTSIIFDSTVDILTNKLKLKQKTLNNKDRILAFDWASTLRAASTKNVKQVLGRSYNRFSFDEAAVTTDFKDLQWLVQDVMPTLLERDGKFAAISTPRGLNVFYDLYKFAEEDSNWDAIKYTIWEVEHIPEEDILTMKEYYEKIGMEKYWKQEFEVEFVSFEGQVYDWSPHLTHISPDIDGDFYIAYDAGRYGALLLLCINEKGVFVLDGFFGETTTSTICDYVHTLEDQKALNLLDGQERWNNVDVYEYYIDSAARQFRIDASFYDVSFALAIKDIEAGISTVNSCSGYVYVNSNWEYAEEFMKQWNLYSYKDNGKPDKKKYRDDLLDAFRYGLHTAKNEFYPEGFPFFPVSWS